jgi:hypothetical protein
MPVKMPQQMTKPQADLIPGHLSGIQLVADRSRHTFLGKLSGTS